MKTASSSEQLLDYLQSGEAQLAREHLIALEQANAMRLLKNELSHEKADQLFEKVLELTIARFGGASHPASSPQFFLRELLESHLLIEWVQSGQNGRKKGLKMLSETYRSKLEKQLHRKLGREEARDMAAQAMVILIENIMDGKFYGKSGIGTYLSAILRNQVSKGFAKQKSVEKYQASLGSPPEVQMPDTFLLEKEMKEAVQTLLENLGEKCRELLRMWMLRYRMKEIASALGYRNESVVRNTKQRCFKKLIEILKANPSTRQQLKELL